jgi:hypothetical protein
LEIAMEKGIGAVTLGSYFGVSRQIIDRLVADKVIKRDAAGRFNLKDCTRAIYRHQMRQITGQARAEATSDAKRKSLEASAKLKAAQTKAAELRMQKESGDLIISNSRNMKRF